MLRYIIKRILLMPVLLLVVCFIIFSLINLSRVDPATQILGNNYSEEDVARLHEELGLDDPIIIQYFNYVKNALKGDLGNSYYTRKSVIEEIGYRWKTSMKLAFITALLTMLFGGLLGIFCSTHQYSWGDRCINMVAKGLAAIPNFWLCLMLLLIFSLKLKWFPSYGISSWKHWILPIANMTIPAVGDYMRYTRSSMLDCVRQDYVRTARAKGNREKTVIFKHTLKNALLPLVTKSGMHFANLMGGAIVVENVYSIPGLGSMIITSIKQKDIPMTVGGTIFLAVIFMVVTLVIDLLYAAIDPRVKATFVKGSGPKKRKKAAASQEGASVS